MIRSLIAWATVLCLFASSAQAVEFNRDIRDRARRKVAELFLFDGARHVPEAPEAVPGVAQRTGATIYYLEFFPRAVAERAGREPVMASSTGTSHSPRVALRSGAKQTRHETLEGANCRQRARRDVSGDHAARPHHAARPDDRAIADRPVCISVSVCPLGRVATTPCCSPRHSPKAAPSRVPPTPAAAGC